MLTWEGDQCFIVSTFAQNHGAWPKKNRQRSAPERYGFAFLPGSFKPVQNTPKKNFAVWNSWILFLKQKTSKDSMVDYKNSFGNSWILLLKNLCSGWFPKVFQWSMVPCYLPLGYGQLLQDHSEVFCFGPLAIKWVTRRRRSKSTEDFFHPSLYSYGWLWLAIVNQNRQ